MKKKSPPYAIIGAVVLGIVAVMAFLAHERAQEKAKQDAINAANAAAAAAIADAKSKNVPAVVPETPTNMRKVLYATQPIAPGVRISPSFFEVKLTPTEVLPDAYTDANSSDIIGWFATRNIEKGDPLTPRNVGKTLPFMEGRIAPGMRAIAMPIFTGGDANATGGFVVDGDRVDLLMSRTPKGGSEIYDTQIVMQNVPVLYVPGPTIKTDETNGLNPVGGAAGTISVMFEVTPEQAQALTLLSQAKEVKFSMILRSRRDTQQVKVKPFTGYDYYLNPKKLQKMTNTSVDRVAELQKEIEAEEAKNQGQGTTNATPTPSSP